jgi:ribonuclease P protein component
VALPQQNRLRHWRDFQAVYQKGIRRSGRYLTLRGLPQRTSNVEPRLKAHHCQGMRASLQLALASLLAKKLVKRRWFAIELSGRFGQFYASYCHEYHQAGNW